MELTIDYIKDLLKDKNRDGSAETLIGEVAFQKRDALKSIAETTNGVTRSNTKWRRCQYIIIEKRASEPVTMETCLKGWKALAQSHGDQTLIIETEPKEWVIYDHNSNIIGHNDEVMTLLKKISEQNKGGNMGILQKIVYGAPGTGKSFGTDDKIKVIYPSKEEQKTNVFRTTFHPDSDYSTFVGAYKPTKNLSQKLLGKEELVSKCKEYATRPGYNNQNLTQFGYDFSLSLQKISKEDKTFSYANFLAEAGVTDTSASSYVTAGMDLYTKTASKIANITYSFVPQTFTKAYIQAWKNYISGDKKPVFLVIEEINRGNCAQIFGDLFQLLDRDDETGMSSYPIKPDTDLGNFIADELSGFAGKVPECQSIIEGEELLLPSNLHIWATMNTSDQSLFPIDSAFKRRWKWEYVKIADKKKGWKIKFAYKDGDEEKSQDRDWWAFIEQINKIIASMTSSADKQLGYFFCKPDKKENGAEKNTIISEEAFVGKVVFYLWNDVFKNYAMDEGNLFKFKAKPDAKEEDLTFPDFYDEEGNFNGYVAAQFIDHVMAWEKDKED